MDALEFVFEAHSLFGELLEALVYPGGLHPAVSSEVKKAVLLLL